jgi:hypothetical protein
MGMVMGVNIWGGFGKLYRLERERCILEMAILVWGIFTD